VKTLVFMRLAWRSAIFYCRSVKMGWRGQEFRIQGVMLPTTVDQGREAQKSCGKMLIKLIRGCSGRLSESVASAAVR
jgi:hypothetical protein